jgi:hypothetical protein
MTTYSIKSIYDLLLLGKRVTIRFSDRKQAESLRVQLVKHNKEFVAVGISDASLCSDWKQDEATSSGSAVYWLGEPRRKTPLVFEILTDETNRPSSEIQDSLDTDP